MFVAGLVLTVSGVAAILFLWFQGTATSTRTKTTSTAAAPITPAVKQGRGVKLVQVSPCAKGSEDTHSSPETDSGIDIIAIHGFDTASPRTWEFKKENGEKVNWLADKHMLPAEVPGTRIFTCNWPAEGLETKDSVSLRIQELALSLLQGILGSYVERERPILFVASCLGGITLMQALVEAKDEYACIREATRGVIFLATPFRGTAFQDSAIWAQPALRIKALVLGKKVSKLLGWLNEPTFDLTRLVGQFTRICKGRDREGIEVFTFYETGTTYLPAQVPFLSFLLPGSRKPFCGPMDSDPDYKSVVEVIQRFLLIIQTGTPLEQADAWIREKYYDNQKLKIERLSGDPLEMSQCYINLALVEIKKVDNSNPMSNGLSPFSLTERLELEIPHHELRVELPDLFRPRKAPDGNNKMPRRILIRGRAGVGKTTLCKKIVYEFIHGRMWQDLFKRVVWIRLRELKNLPNDDYSPGRVLRNIFFQQPSQHTYLPDQICNRLSTELWRHIEHTLSGDTLFLLDGLDEVPEFTMEYRHGNPHPGQHFLKGLLNRPNVIITTRPHAVFPSDFQQPHLELDTMGFSRVQVQTYIEAVEPRDKDTIQAYLKKHRIMQSLVQIPVQLDALCFTWQASSVWNTIIPETMTAVYEAMIREFWRKDNERLEKDGFQFMGNAFPAETDPFDSTQYENLGYLAFSGLCSNVIEYQPRHRNALYRFMKKERTTLSFDETFARLSFWRTSDPSNSLPNQSYHFIHLAFQESFSAKHFAKAWRCDKDLEYVELDGEKPKIKVVSCCKFLRSHKFTVRYNIMWRFVAGILDEDEAQTSRFFQAIECEPIDILGPTQQRLVMNCLTEVTRSADLRARLEDQLSQWLEFEVNFTRRSRVIREAEFPERAINLVLERASEDNRILILRLGYVLPFTTVELITGWLERGQLSQPLRVAALWALRGRSLPTRTLNAAVALMDNDDEDTRDLSVKLLRSQVPWPDGILRGVMTRLESQDPDQDSGIKERTARALGGHPTLSVALLQRLASWISDQCPSTTTAVLSTLKSQHTLDADIIRILATTLEDQPEYIRVLAFDTLKKRKNLPLDILDKMVAIYLDLEDVSHEHPHRPSDDMLQAIKRSLENQDTNIQRMALKLLYREQKREELPFIDVFDIILRWLEGGDNQSRYFALTLLDGESKLPGRVTEAVITQLENHDQRISHLALEILLVQDIRCGHVINKTIEMLKLGDKNQRTTILRYLGHKHPSPPGVLKATVEQLQNQEGSIRRTALQTLARFASQETFPNDVISAIVQMVFHADESTQRAAIKALPFVWHRQRSPPEMLKELLAELKSHDTMIRKAALGGLARLDGQHSLIDGTLDSIAVHLAEPEHEIRCTAADTLRDLAHTQVFPNHVIGALVTLLEDPAKEIRCTAADTLRDLARKQVFPEHILSAIAPVIEGTERKVKWKSVMALRILSGGQALPDHLLRPVAGLLADTDNAFQGKAVEILGRLGHLQSFPPDVLEVIADRLGDPRKEIGRFAFEALANQPRLPEDTLQAMVVLGLKGAKTEIKAAFRLIRQLDNMSEEIRGLLVTLLDYKAERVRYQAVEALAEHGSLSDDTYPAIARLLLTTRYWGKRKWVLELLGTCSTLSDDILQTVTRALDDNDREVKEAAAETLKVQDKLPDTIFKSTALYSMWLRRSFEEDVYCTMEDGFTYFEWRANFGRRPLWGEPSELREAIRKIQMELGMPTGSKEMGGR
ncbi:hypothetical protein NW766_011034 [Fusarium irregulare]|uniref:NACHT domain-containing protein n=1 Tax=Fusarium irregulare TaxID=2494466 RepID=A0A9W8U694_9HYPO|nr:hypothetical protein NW766_011034 [Fusarium irregulare]